MLNLCLLLQQGMMNHLLGYIGPGAGLAISFSFLTLLAVIGGVILVVVLSPITLIMMKSHRRRGQKPYPFQKAVILGLDGFDPKIIKRLMEEGKAPNFSELSKEGYFSPLATTFPAISPVAWSSFMTGSDPSYHNIYDFITRDLSTYQPKLSSSEIIPSRYRLKIGKYQIPFGKSYVRSLRKNIPFWTVLGKHGLETTVLRVPITFPPEPFRGRLLSGMCVPDLWGSQGSYSYYATRDCRKKNSDGHFVMLKFVRNRAQTEIRGPRHPFLRGDEYLKIPLKLRKTNAGKSLEFSIGREHFELNVGEASDWLDLSFHAGPTTIYGQAQFHLISLEPDVQIYLSPIHIHPERPVMAVSHPKIFSDFLGKRIGPYGTLGLMEDTTALNDGVLGKSAFLKQVRQYYEERKKMLFEVLDKKVDDTVVCVFDTPDRIQHMFWKDQEEASSPNKKVIEQTYIEMDHLLGEIRKTVSNDTLLLVLSDHGFTGFKRGVNLNSWLYQNGYLELLTDSDLNQDWLSGVDWAQTQAYAMGLAGIYINLKGREVNGIVKPGREFDELTRELKNSLETLLDEDGSSRPIRRIYCPANEMDGPFRSEGPDLVIGYEAGYRCSWEGAKGQVTEKLFADNTHTWSGDHCVDPAVVPGVLFSNYPFKENQPRIVDIAPTILDLFGCKPESFMQGRSLFKGGVQ